MQIVIQLSTSKMAHMTNQQIGAFVAHCYTLKDLCYVQVWKADYAGGRPYANIAFNLPSTASLVDSAKISSQLSDALNAFAEMDPFPCPCGCGAFISVSPCLRQSGQLVETQLNNEEMALARAGNRISAIKSLRDRFNANVPRNPATGMFEPGSGALGLKEAKDMVDAYLMTNPPLNLPF